MRAAIAGLVAAACLACAPAQGRELQVVASIKPVHALASLVMGDTGHVDLLVGGNASEHIYSLRPSQARALADADLVVWAGPQIESFLVRPVASLDAGHVLALTQVAGLTLLPFREGGPFEAHDDGAHEGDEDHERDHEHEEGAFDGHVWLDPHNAVVIVNALADAFAARDAEHASLYHANAQAAVSRLQALDGELAAMLAPVEGKPFIVFHDAYHYLEHRYGLNTVGSVTVNPEVPASAKRVSELKARIVRLGAVCLFAEPQFDPKLIRSLKDGTGARSGVLDPLGAAIPEGPDQYFEMMRDLGRALTGCLAP